MTDRGLNYMPGGVIRWEGDTAPSLLDQLHARPGVWAVVGENITGDSLGWSGTPWASLRGLDGIEIHVSPVDDGEYGVLYEVRVRFDPQDDDGTEPD